MNVEPYATNRGVKIRWSEHHTPGRHGGESARLQCLTPCAGARSSAVRHVGNEPAAAAPSITIQAAADAGSSIFAPLSEPARWNAWR